MRQGDTATTERSVLTYELQKKPKGLDTDTTYNLSVFPETHGSTLGTITGKELNKQARAGGRERSRAVGPVPVCALGNTTAKTTITEKNNP